MKRIADILVDELIKHGLEQVFLVTGGGAMHLNDAFGRRRDRLRICCNHHEQACAIAAEGYARLTGKPAIVNVTTGPGGINALNGVYGAYVDSIPMIVISGQIKRDTMLRNVAPALRQLGDQEADILPMARTVTKYAVELQNPRRVREVVAKAVHVAQSGRPGPVWIDVPMDIQGGKIDESRLYDWNPEDEQELRELRGDPDLARNSLADFTLAGRESMRRAIGAIIERLRSSKRPVIMGGTGIHLCGLEKEFRQLGEKLGIPLVGGWNAYDLVPNDHPCYAGRPGTVGDRPGNFTVQNADFLLILGCRCNIRQISYNWEAFAPHAWKAQVDADSAELAKPTLRNDLAVQADLRDFLPLLLEAVAAWEPQPEHKNYLAWCGERVRRYPVLQDAWLTSPQVNPYYFMDRLFRQLGEGDVVVAANATAAVVSSQVGLLRDGVRLFSNSGDASMGYDLPAAIGAVLSGKAKRIICLAGDGSIMMNLQELQTIIGLQLPILIFLLNNQGYLSIRMTQSAYFADNKFGTGPENGVPLPDFMKLAEALGYEGCRLASHEEVDALLADCLAHKGPAFYEVMLDPAQQFEPKLASRALPDGTMVSPALDDMAPFLDEAELAENRLA
ncbi:thiamine pyrophosphate-binding protein [uncultured Desulfovibrio sp.]|uniref:thiamine pyrophosphate-binding protein n=1 Tax=uncultured Desulfovibrio sp. TaxID=167968 RepID=UPI00263400C8|nr:thiamine pyrophosphate-binding protein [uncultured Desulfovibrio sp.]